MLVDLSKKYEWAVEVTELSGKQIIGLDCIGVIELGRPFTDRLNIRFKRSPNTIPVETFAQCWAEGLIKEVDTDDSV